MNSVMGTIKEETRGATDAGAQETLERHREWVKRMVQATCEAAEGNLEARILMGRMRAN